MRLTSRCVVLLACLTAGCGSRHSTASVVARPAASSKPTPATSSTSPSASPLPVQTYSNAAAGIQFDYPRDWKPERAQTACFDVTAPIGTGGAYASLSLDIPKLPWHIRNMIPMGIVARDYISDLKKGQIPDAVVKEQTNIPVPDASARRITCEGNEKGRPTTDVAVILIHSDQVFILSADSDASCKALARRTLDEAVASLKWTK